ncbi:MAG TPA: hypothetical protein VGA67_00770, partial [Candidatus Dojkabacteria bacterium]
IEKKFYIGASSMGTWASVYTYKPKNEHILEEKGEVFAVITLKGPRSFNASTAGNLLLDFFHESYFEGDHSSSLICLEKAAINTAKKLAEIVDNDKNIGDMGINLEVTSVAIVGQIIYMVSMGQGGIYLLRDGNVVNVNSVLKDPTGDGYVKSASGVIEEDDVVLLLTERGVDAYTKDEIVSAMASFSESELKNKPLENESELSIILIGYEPKIKHVENDVDEDIAKSFIKKKEEIQIQSEPEEEIVYDQVEGEDSEELEGDYPEEIHENPATLKEKITGIFSKSKKNFSNLELGQKIKDKWQNIKPEGSEDTTVVYIAKTIRFNVRRFAEFMRRDVWEGFFQMDQGLYLKNARRGTNWRFLAFLGVLAILLIFLGMRGISSRNESARQNREVTEAISNASSQLDDLEPEITSIIGVVEVYNRERSGYQTTINQLKSELERVKGYELKEDEINDLVGRLNLLDNKLNRKVVLQDPNILTDFVVNINEDANPSDMAISSDTIYVSDEARGVIYSMSFNGRDLKEFATGLKSPRSITFGEDGLLYGVDDDSSQPFFSVNPNNAEIKRYSGIAGGSFSSIDQLEAFELSGSQRIYFIKNDGAPVQYIGQVGSGFAGPIARISSEEYRGTRDMEISDSKIYLLIPGQGAIRFAGDQVEEFGLVGLSTGELSNISNSSSFDVAGNFVIYGNSQGNSVLFATKSRGETLNISDYTAQFVYEGSAGFFGDIREINADIAQNSVFVLDASRVIKLNYSDISQFVY